MGGWVTIRSGWLLELLTGCKVNFEKIDGDVMFREGGGGGGGSGKVKVCPRNGLNLASEFSRGGGGVYIKNSHILPTGQWYAPSAVINIAKM